MIDFETKKVLFIDLDSTLIKTISGKIIEKMPNLSMFFYSK